MFDQMVTPGNSADCLLPSVLPAAPLQIQGKEQKLEGLLNWERHEELLRTLADQQTQLQTRLQALRTTLNASLPTCKPEPPAAVLQTECMWKLALKEPMLLPICKGKYFSLHICLEPLRETAFSAQVPLPVALSLETSDIPGQSIQVNMIGRPVIRGDSHCVLRYDASKQTHTGNFRVQITEVSSHYVNGWIRLVVAAEGSAKGLVQALVLDDVVVRAKEKTCRKFREREEEGLPQRRVKNRRPIATI